MRKSLAVTFILVSLVLFSVMQAYPGETAKAFDPVNMDLSVRPGEDFTRYAGGNWLKNNPVPPEYPAWNSFSILIEKSTKDLRAIFDEASKNKNVAEGSFEAKIGAFYATALNTKKREADGIKPLQKELDRIDAVSNKEELPKLVAHFHTFGIANLFMLQAQQDPSNSDLNIAWIYQGGLGLPDRDYYLEDADSSKEIRTKYIEHMIKMFGMLKVAPEKAGKMAKTIMAMETRMAEASLSRVESRDPKKQFNKKSLAKMAELSPHFDFAAYFNNIGATNPGDINVAQPQFIKELSLMIKEVSLDDWKAYMRWHLLMGTANYLTPDMEKVNFEFFSKCLFGQKKMKPLWKRCLIKINGLLSELVGQIYVKKHFPPEAKTKAYNLVLNLKKAFAKRIKNVKWMSEVTKKKALAKLDAFKIKIGYPDKWTDYSPLVIKRESYIANVFRARKFRFEVAVKKINTPVDRGEWFLAPQAVNAYYHPIMNEIVFPAAILQEPFYNFKADDAINYGAIGAVIGHEMTHGFDDAGREYDLEGNLNNWWQDADAEKFKKRADVLVEQFNKYVMLEDAHVDGKLTLGENIADLGGLSIAYDALLSVLPEKPAKIDGFTPQQRFFLSWAKIWRENANKEYILMRLKIDVHSPGKVRILGPFSNMPSFYKAFDVKESDAMYRAEKDRVKIW
ncbi:MAG: M13 family metallopeptidase [bacterium]|nr:M13 family metallopeptidase [bacterium]